MDARGAGRRVDFLIPPPLEGSGGHRTAVSAAEALARAGFDVHIHFQPPRGPDDTVEEVREMAARWHGLEHSSVHLEWPDAIPQTDAVVATTWRSAVTVATMKTDAVRMHFVQDYEAWFHAMGDEYLAAIGVHDAGLQSIVIGNWLQHQLLSNHELASWTMPFTADLDIYRVASDSERTGPPTVVAMYQPEKPRRCGNLMSAALRRVLELNGEARVVTLGSQRAPSLGDRHTHLGLVGRTQLPDIYAAATVGLSLSSSNPSRVPFEMMATGLPVIELGTPNTLYDFPDSGCLLAHPDPESVASALLRVVGDPGVAKELSSGGVEFMLDRPERLEAESVVDAVSAALTGEPPAAVDPPMLYPKAVHREPGPIGWFGGDSNSEGALDPLGVLQRDYDALLGVNRRLADDLARIRRNPAFRAAARAKRGLGKRRATG